MRRPFTSVDRGLPVLRRTARRGVTLLELLIVITILALVTAATIPLMLSGVDARRTRETARLVSSYFSSARSRAIETGRSAGVMIVRSNSGLVPGGTSINLVTVECPTLYSGDTLLSTATVATNGQVSFNSVDNIAANVHVGDIIRFGYQGRTYLLTGSGSQSTGQALPGGSSPYSMLSATDNTGVLALPIPAGSMNAQVPFQVTRQPVKSAVPPLQLPEGVVIDMLASGFGLPGVGLPIVGGSPIAGYFVADSNPVVLVFSPTGSLEEVFFYGSLQGHPASTFCFLIGTPDQVATTTNTDANLLDGNSIWVAVTPRGRVITAENAINTAATTNAGSRAFIYGYGTGAGGTGGIATSLGGG